MAENVTYYMRRTNYGVVWRVGRNGRKRLIQAILDCPVWWTWEALLAHTREVWRHD